MSEAERTTLRSIFDAAKAEFLEKGFRGASLRNIVKTANVTTGAFYGYFNSKEELFDAIVGEQADYAMSAYKRRRRILQSWRPKSSLNV